MLAREKCVTKNDTRLNPSSNHFLDLFIRSYRTKASRDVRPNSKEIAMIISIKFIIIRADVRNCSVVSYEIIRLREFIYFDVGFRRLKNHPCAGKRRRRRTYSDKDKT